jgi:NhaP-type Na+/H+ or K+/H+ antiporter
MSYGIGPELDLANFNIVLTVLGVFVSCLGLISYVVKERLYISDSLIALLIGVAFGPLAANLIRPAEYGQVDEVTLSLTRLVIGLQLVLAGIQLPSLYCVRQWKSLVMLVVPIMALKWIIAALVIFLVFPISYMEALAVGACITPTYASLFATSLIIGIPSSPMQS